MPSHDAPPYQFALPLYDYTLLEPERFIHIVFVDGLSQRRAGGVSPRLGESCIRPPARLAKNDAEIKDNRMRVRQAVIREPFQVEVREVELPAPAVNQI